jgi:hypothetical protein
MAAAGEFLGKLASEIKKTKEAEDENASQLRKYIKTVSDIQEEQIETRRRILKLVREKDARLCGRIEDRLKAGIAVGDLDVAVDELLKKHDPDLLRRKQKLETVLLRLKGAGEVAMKHVLTRAKGELDKKEKLDPEERETRELLEKMSNLL